MVVNFLDQVGFFLKSFVFYFNRLFFVNLAMQEEVLKLILLALEDGSALSRKVLVLFVVQKLAPQYPRASKTSVGHVVQLLYRASCFKVKEKIIEQFEMNCFSLCLRYKNEKKNHH